MSSVAERKLAIGIAPRVVVTHEPKGCNVKMCRAGPWDPAASAAELAPVRKRTKAMRPEMILDFGGLE